RNGIRELRCRARLGRTYRGRCALHRSSRSRSGPFRVDTALRAVNVALSTSERLQLAALVDRVIPRDAFPSAIEAGFFEFIARNAGSLSALVDALRPGLARLEQQRFADASSADQDTMLHTLEAEQEMRRFVAMATTLATQSYYSDEASGGNAGHRSWQMIGFDPAPKRAFLPIPS